MDKSLSPRDAASELGITTDTLRRWDREGRIEAQRTPGGQRRYREADIHALLADAERVTTRRTPHLLSRRGESNADNDEELLDCEPEPTVKSPTDVPPWERRVREQRAELEVTKIQRERQMILREDREAEEARLQAEEDEAQAAINTQRENKERESARQQEQERLERLRRYGRALSLLAPPEYQAKVTRDLESFVNPSQFPVGLGDVAAYQYLSARVEQLLAPWRAVKETERREAVKASERAHKISLAMIYARTRTYDWDSEDATVARADVQEALEDEVAADWSNAELHELVDDVLDDFE